MVVQVDGQDVDLRVLRLGPNDRLAVHVEVLNQRQWGMLHDVLVRWSGLSPERVIILHKNMDLSVVSPTEQAEPGKGADDTQGVGAR